MLPFPLWMPPTAMVIISAITFRMYAHDKQQATANGWRVPEASLCLAELLGGWPGAVLAQRRLRHKCSKDFYQAAFWGIVASHQILAVNTLSDHRLSAFLIDCLSQASGRVKVVGRQSQTSCLGWPVQEIFLQRRDAEVEVIEAFDGGA